MKKVNYFAIITVLMVASAYPQTQNLISGNVSHGGYGGPVIKFSQFDGEWGVLSGGRGAWVVNHTFTLGGGGYSITNDVFVEGAEDITGFKYLQLNYGGPEIGIVFGSDRLVHGTFHTLLGWGEVAYTNSIFNHEDRGDLWDRSRDNIFILEPEVNIVLNVTSFFRVGGALSYRKAFGLDDEKYYPVDNFIDGLSYGAVFKFGKF